MTGGFFRKAKNYKGNDNWNTQSKDWLSIKDFIPTDKVIWCPFYGDGKQKEHFKNMGFDIIQEKEDFFDNDKGDVVIDNIPFSIKRLVIERLKELNKPFIVIMPLEVLCYNYYQPFLADTQLIIPKNRMNFIKPDNTLQKFKYECIYFCWKMNLKNDLNLIDN